MKKSHLQYRLLKPFYNKEAKKMCNDFKNYITKGDKVLDLGCGSGIVANKIKSTFKVQVKGIDIIDMREVDIPFEIYDGKDLSFIKDNEFDVVLISYVLHHTGDLENILSQAKRIAKKHIIMYEDLNEGFFGKFYCLLHGKLYDWVFLKNNIPARFLSEKEWKELFKELNLDLIHSKEKKYKLSFVKRKAFILEKRVCSSAG